MRSSMSRSNHMLIALAPPAIRYPPTQTQNTRDALGSPCPVMNIGAIVVTRSREMIRGLVRVMRSAIRDGASAARRLGRLGLETGSRPVR